MDDARGQRGRVHEVRDLVGPEGDGQVGPHVRATQGAPVHVDPGRHVDGYDGHAGKAGQHGLRVVAQARSAADADDAVDEHVGFPRVLQRDRTATMGPKRLEAGGMHLRREQYRLDRHPPAREHRPRPQRVTAVVPRPNKQQHPAGVDGPQEIGDRHQQPGGRALHQGTLGELDHQCRLRRPHLLDRVCSAHAAQVSGRVPDDALWRVVGHTTRRVVDR